MSLNGALHVGRSAIVASQAGLQVAGNNMANAATPGYSRQVMHLAPAQGEHLGGGTFVGRGVMLQTIARQVDTALQARLRDAISREHGAVIDQRFLTAIETLQNELTENDLSTLLSEFFNSFSELANAPEDSAVRSVVLQQGANLADHINQLRTEYNGVRSEIDRDLGTAVEAADGILTELSKINLQIAQTEQGHGTANALRDRRDQLVDELAKFLDVSTVEQPNGSVDVFVGSIPIVLAGESRGLEMKSQAVDGKIEVAVRVKADGSKLDVSSGRIGALMSQREETVDPAIDALDDFASQLIRQVNRLHSQGQGRHGHTSITGTSKLGDTTVNLNHIDADLPFRIENGSFFLHVTHSQSGERLTYQVDVDGDAMSLDDLVNEINSVIGVPNVTASVSASGEFVLNAASGYEISFSDDSSGALAALGINTFFAGRSAADIAVNPLVSGNPNLLAARSGHVEGSNGTAIAIANLQDLRLDDLGGQSLREFWQSSMNQLAVRTDAAHANVASTRLVRESIHAQAQAVSGVSLDEEAINLMTYQRQFQAAARFISVIDETLQTLLSLA